MPFEKGNHININIKNQIIMNVKFLTIKKYTYLRNFFIDTKRMTTILPTDKILKLQINVIVERTIKRIKKLTEALSLSFLGKIVSN